MLVILQGGLGNQMFQYAFAKALESAFHTKVKMHASSAFKDSQSSDKNKPNVRNMEITSLNITLDILTTEKQMQDFYYKNDKCYVINSNLAAKSKIADFIIRKIIPRKFRSDKYKYIVYDNNELVDILADVKNGKCSYKSYKDNGGGGESYQYQKYRTYKAK